MLRIRVLELRIPICAAGGGMGVWVVMCNQLANRTGDAHVGRQQLQHLADSAYTHNTEQVFEAAPQNITPALRVRLQITARRSPWSVFVYLVRRALSR